MGETALSFEIANAGIWGWRRALGKHGEPKLRHCDKSGVPLESRDTRGSRTTELLSS